MGKTYKNKRKFIDVLVSMSDDEINNYIKEHGKPPKLIEMVVIVNKEKK